MIHRATVSLCAVIGLCAAGFVACCVGFVRTLNGEPVALSDVALVGVLFCGVTGAGLWSLFRAEFKGQQARDAMALEERRAKLPAAVVIQPEPVEVTAAPPDGQLEHAWRVALGRVITAGNAHGFKYRDIAAGPYKVVEWEDWPALRGPLIEMGVLVERSGTRWAEDWNMARWAREGAALPLPPVTGEPPRVEITVNTAQQQRPTTEKQPIIEHERRPA